jgi:Protein of unknown function (DUF1501)
MSAQEKFDQFIKRHPHPHVTFFNRPHLSRRRFFQVLGAGVTGSYLVTREARADTSAVVTPALNVTTKNTAQNVIFILLAGAPSHVDTFDFKMTPGTTPAAAAPETINGILWPTAIFPNLAKNIPDFAIVRSMSSHALVHSLGQTWTQIGRNPAAALGNIAPNIGSIVAIEKTPERVPSKVFPTFVALNSGNASGSGYLSSSYAPFRVTPSTGGLPDTSNVDGQVRMDQRWSLLHAEDDVLRVNSPLGKSVDDMDSFYSAAKGLMYNNAVSQAFSYAAADSTRYGGNSFGNACLVAKQILAADQGTRYIEITLGGWDMHQNIYGAGGNIKAGTNIFTLGNILDNGLSTLINDLKAAGLFDRTMIVMAGEFGRTVGAITAAGGRDHFLHQFAFFAGGGVKGGRVIGSTDSRGATTVDPGWSRQRDVNPEDIEATIYSAMGINWTNIRYDDPFGRGFEYVPFAATDTYGPINELWG